MLVKMWKYVLELSYQIGPGISRQIQVSQTRVSKKWLISTYFQNIDKLLNFL